MSGFKNPRTSSSSLFIILPHRKFTITFHSVLYGSPPPSLTEKTPDREKERHVKHTARPVSIMINNRSFFRKKYRKRSKKWVRVLFMETGWMMSRTVCLEWSPGKGHDCNHVNTFNPHPMTCSFYGIWI